MRRYSQLAISVLTALAVSVLSCSEPTEQPSTFLNPKQPVERRINDLVRRLRPDEQLALLRKQVADEAEEERNNPDLSRAELQEFARNRETLRLAEERLAIDDWRWNADAEGAPG